MKCCVDLNIIRNQGGWFRLQRRQGKRRERGGRERTMQGYLVIAVSFQW